MTVGFVVWNPFQVFHMGPIVEYLDDPMFVVVRRKGRDALREDFGGSIGSFIDLPHQIVSPRELVGLDGKIDSFVCPNPFPGMNALVKSRRIGIQYSMTKESYQYGTWRGQFDLNLAYGDYTARKLLQYGPVVGVGNPRFTPWFKQGMMNDEAPTKKQPTVLYLPTWGEFSSVPTFLPAIDALQDEYNVIAKLHHKSYLTEPETTDQLGATNLDQSLSPKDDLLPLLREADVIISDFSGAIFDAIYVEKPVILLQEDPESLVGRKFTFDSAEYARREDIGPVVSSPDQLRDTIAAVLDGSLDFRERNARLRTECFAEDIDAAERCADVLSTVSIHRRNPGAGRISGTRSVVTARRPVEARTARFERSINEREAAGTVPKVNPDKEEPQTLWRRTLRSTVVKGRAPQVVSRLTAAAPGASAASVRTRLERLSLRLEPALEFAIEVLETRYRQDRLTPAEQLWLADFHFVSDDAERAIDLLSGLSLCSELDLEAVETLRSAYGSLSGPMATWDAQVGLQPRAPLPAATNRQLSVAPPASNIVLRRVIDNAASVASGQGSLDVAVDLRAASVRLDDDDPDARYQYARALEQAFRFDLAPNAFAETVRRSPLSRTHRRSHSRLGSKLENWELARTEALACVDTPAIDVTRQFGSGRRVLAPLDVLDQAFRDVTVVDSEEFLSALEVTGPMAGSRPWEYWMALHWRLIRAHRFRAAYRIKDHVALSILDDVSESRKIDVRSTLVLARALMTLGRFDEAQDFLELRLAFARTPAPVHSVSKALADAKFFQGETKPLLEWYRNREDESFPQPAALATARDLIRGKRVVVAGPSARSMNDADFVESLRSQYDLIVRTNLATSTVNGPSDSPAADLVYFNSGIAQLGLAGLLSASAEQGVSQVVLRRPRELASLMPDIESGRVRLTDVEPGCHLFASSFGVQRTIYDLAVHEPASIDVRNIDFFTGETEYAEGYKVENADVSFRGFSHDFRGDFIMSSHLSETGAVRFDALATSILDTSVEEYLARLDAKPSGD